MITAAIGKTFLDAYNEKYGTNFDAQTFFVEVYHPLFFDSNKYLFWVNNSPFDQMKKAHKAEIMNIDERRQLLQELISKINDSDSPDASIAPGFPASVSNGMAGYRRSRFCTATMVSATPMVSLQNSAAFLISSGRPVLKLTLSFVIG